MLFQSTPPARGATCHHCESRNAGAISIHAPREGGRRYHQRLPCAGAISIHAPREGGDSRKDVKHDKNDPAISIHAPREGGDNPRSYWRYCHHCDFNPRPPRGGRLYCSRGIRPAS